MSKPKKCIRANCSSCAAAAPILRFFTQEHLPTVLSLLRQLESSKPYSQLKLQIPSIIREIKNQFVSPKYCDDRTLACSAALYTMGYADYDEVQYGADNNPLFNGKVLSLSSAIFLVFTASRRTTTQLQMMKCRALTRGGRWNHNIISYAHNYDAYGYLSHRASDQSWNFLIRGFDPHSLNPKFDSRLSQDKRAELIMRFCQACHLTGISSIEIEKELLSDREAASLKQHGLIETSNYFFFDLRSKNLPELKSTVKELSLSRCRP